MIAKINRILPFSNVDGPGNRLVFFFQGCPFHCQYCHNPETINDCIHCGECVKHCLPNALSIVNKKVVWDKSKCVECDECLKVCVHNSSPRILYWSVDQCLEEVKNVSMFISGITCSGGECMTHAEFMFELFSKVKELGLTCLIDSNGYYDFSSHLKLMSVCDGVMLDVKAVDKKFHETLVQKSNETVLKNLNWLLNENKLQEVRTVLLPKFPEQNEHTVTEVAKILNNRSFYKIIKYRPYGVNESGLIFCGDQELNDEEANRCMKLALKYTNHVGLI